MRSIGRATLFVLAAAVIVTPTISIANHTGAAAGQVGGFEVDGDFAYPYAPPISGATRDWATIDGVGRKTDPVDSISDDSFGGGNKEQEPDGWTFVAHKPESKGDLARMYAAAEVNGSHAYLFLGFERLSASGQGDVHVDFEMNRLATTVVNSMGTTIPQRSNGDLLVTYDYNGGNSDVFVGVYEWSGTAFAGSWVAQSMPAGSVLGDINGAGITRPSTFPFGGGTVDAKDFGEAVVDLHSVFGSSFPGCPGFASGWAKTRSSGESIDSQLKDVISPMAMDISQCPDVRVTKTASASGVDAGGTFAYTVTATNAGVVTAHGVTVSDAVPAGLDVLSATPSQGTCTTGPVSCSIGTLAPGANATVTILVRATTAACGVVHNVASVSATDEPSTLQSDDTSGDVAVTVRCPDVRIQKSTSTPKVSAGDSISYDLAVSNDGTGAATGVSVTDTLPAGFAWSIDPAVPGCVVAGGTLSCSFETLEAGASVAIHLVASTTSENCGTIANSASVSAANEPEQARGNNAAGPVSITIDCASLVVTKTPDAPTVSAGDPIGFTISVHNAGAGNAHGVTLTDPMPGGMAWSIDGGTGAGACTTSATLSCSFGTMASGATQTVHIAARTTPEQCGVVTNTATVTASNTAGNSATAHVTVNCPSLSITKTADAPTATASDPIGFTITVSNAGPGNAYGVTITDPLPAGSGLAWSTSTDGCSITTGTLNCSVGTLAPGTSASAHVTSQTTSSSCATHDNTATVHATNAGPQSATASVTVLCASIQIDKTADSATATAGGQIGFTIAVANPAEGEARTVHVSDQLPGAPGLSWTIDGGSMASGCFIDGGMLECDLTTLAPGGHADVHISSPTAGLTCGPIRNEAAVTTANDGSESSAATVTVDCPVGIALTKDGPALAHVGDTVTYTMTVASTTITPLTSVAVTDPVCDSAPAYTGGDGGVIGSLETGETWSYTCSHVVTATDPDPLPNTATATGVGNDHEVSSQASHLVDIIHPAIALDKSASPLSGHPGASLTYTYVVCNTGDASLANVTVDDDRLGHIGDIASLAAGACQTLTRSTVFGNDGGQVINIGTATGTDPLKKKVTAHDTATVSVVLAVKLVKTGTGPVGWRLGLGLMAAGAALVFAGRRRRRAAR